LTKQQIKREAERLIRESKMPTLEQLTAVILEARMKYANQIRRARQEGK